jgi:hypothetical protein
MRCQDFRLHACLVWIQSRRQTANFFPPPQSFAAALCLNAIEK